MNSLSYSLLVKSALFLFWMFHCPGCGCRKDKTGCYHWNDKLHLSYIHRGVKSMLHLRVYLRLSYWSLVQVFVALLNFSDNKVVVKVLVVEEVSVTGEPAQTGEGAALAVNTMPEVTDTVTLLVFIQPKRSVAV